MKNISKIKVLIFLIILFLISSVNSYGINMNLENTISTNTTNIVQESLTEDNSLEENINNDNDDTETENSSPKVTTTNKTDEDELLTVENILSIIIIVIGILLIFLSIAILIRFK